MSNYATDTARVVVPANDGSVSPTVVHKKRGPKPGSKRASKAEIVTRELSKLLALASGISEAQKAEILAEAAKGAANLTTAVSGVDPRLSEIKQSRLPIGRALRKLETRRRYIAKMLAEVALLEPHEADMVVMRDYYDTCEALFTEARNTGKSFDSVVLPAKPEIDTQFLLNLKQIGSVAASHDEPSDTDMAIGIDNLSDSDDDSDDDDNDDGA